MSKEKKVTDPLFEKTRTMLSECVKENEKLHRTIVKLKDEIDYLTIELDIAIEEANELAAKVE